MNLLNNPWMPVRDAQGQRHWITPAQLGDPKWIAFDADRPDFNGALAQFAIGLLQTTTPVGNSLAWSALHKAPPDATTLQRWFAPVVTAFELDGDGPRFMQDRYLKPSVKNLRDDNSGGIESVQQMLIDCAGEGEKADNNTDHFNKRKASNYGLCECCCAAALYALQTNAPSSGRGYLVSIRGGGPLTTLVKSAAELTLWHDLWINVMDRPLFDGRPGRREESDLRFTFPWLSDLRFLQPAGIATLHFEGPKGGPKPTEDEKPRLQPSQVTPSHAYWGMPRRIKLDFESVSVGVCGVCGRQAGRLTRSYLIKNYGLNYKGSWTHPLSPYYETKDGWLPVHPQADGLGYRHWLAWVLGASTDKKSTRVAQVVERALQLPHRQTGGTLRLWAFGYDMDKMKARCWYESTMPLYGLADCDRDTRQGVQAEVGGWLTAAELACWSLRDAVKTAWFGANAPREFGHVDASFWGATEAPFYRQLQTLIEAARTGTEPAPLPAREAWHATLVRCALRLFDDTFVGAGAIERQNPHRTALAHRQLRRNLHGPKLRQALGLPTDAPAAKPARKSAKSAPGAKPTNPPKPPGNQEPT